MKLEHEELMVLARFFGNHMTCGSEGPLTKVALKFVDYADRVTFRSNEWREYTSVLNVRLVDDHPYILEGRTMFAEEPERIEDVKAPPEQNLWYSTSAELE